MWSLACLSFIGRFAETPLQQSRRFEMSLIQGYGSASFLNAPYTSGVPTSSSSASPSSLDGSNMTISQIRDITDQMAINGQLTSMQDLHLEVNGLMDLNPADPSYQPDMGGVGYSRSDTGTYNFSDMMNGEAAFDASQGFTQNASAERGIAQAFQEYEKTTNTLSATA
jgi:hypothetical protein